MFVPCLVIVFRCLQHETSLSAQFVMSLCVHCKLFCCYVSFMSLFVLGKLFCFSVTSLFVTVSCFVSVVSLLLCF